MDAGLKLGCIADDFTGATDLANNLVRAGMRAPPLTPRTDANLVRVMQAQCQDRVGLIAHDVVREGPAAIRARIADLQSQGARFGIVDAIDNGDLLALGQAIADAPLVVAGS